MKHSIGELRELTISANKRRELEEQRKRQEEEDRKRQQEAYEELEFAKDASAILESVLDKAHEAASTGRNVVSAYEIPSHQIDFNTSPMYNGIHATITSGWYGRDMAEHEYVLAGPLKVAVRILKSQGFKTVVRRNNATNFTGGGGSSVSYVLDISW